MRGHRLIWAIAGLAVVAAMAAVSFRTKDVRQFEADVAAMLARLETDPQARLPETRAAVNRVVETAQYQERQMPETYYALALRLYGQDRVEDAEQSLRSALALRPDWALAHNGLGIMLLAQDRTEDAEAAFRRAAELAPDWSRPHNDLAILYRITGRLEEAEQAALKAIALDPNTVDVRNNYGNLLIRMKRFAEAEEQYQAALAVDPTHPWPHFNLACLYAQTDRPTLALDHLEQAITHFPPFRDEARTDPDLEPLRDDLRFIELVGDNAD